MTISVTADAGTDELTWASAHGCVTGEMVSFTAGTMPSPLVAGTSYYAIVSSTTVMKVATTRVNALAATAIDLTTTGSTVVGTRDTGRLGEANLSVQDGGAFVKLSNVPLAVLVILDNMLVGAQVRVVNGTRELYNGTAAMSTVSFTTKIAGNASGTVRKAGYREYTFNVNIDPTNGGNAYISQVADGTS